MKHQSNLFYDILSCWRVACEAALGYADRLLFHFRIDLATDA